MKACEAVPVNLEVVHAHTNDLQHSEALSDISARGRGYLQVVNLAESHSPLLKPGSGYELIETVL